MKLVSSNSPKDLPLNGLRVLDLSWIIAGPLVGRFLGMHGADVIRVESETRTDVTRSIPPWPNGIPGRNRGGLFDAFNSDKLSVLVNLKMNDGKEIIKKLVAWADIVLESFAPGFLAREGLAYEDLKKVKPDIIMMSFSTQGQTGPMSSAKGFGSELQALVGFSNFIGYPGAPPLLTTIPVTDFIIPWFALIAILTALEHRRRTGEGQYIDISHLETGSTFLAVKFMQYFANGKLEPRVGNRSPRAAPHGAYRLRGQDRWCVIAVFDDRQWRSLKRVMGHPRWAWQSEFRSLLDRKNNEDELDRLIGEWTCQQSEEIIGRLQAAGVPAGIVATGQDLYKCPQLRHRGHFVELTHQEMGPHCYEAPSWRSSETLFEICRPSPCFGDHTAYVCTEILGISEEEFVNFYNQGVLK